MGGRTIRVGHQKTREVYWEGTWARAVIPDRCVWTYGGRQGGMEGLVLEVEKLNAELYARYNPNPNPNPHPETW